MLAGTLSADDSADHERCLKVLTSIMQARACEQMVAASAGAGVEDADLEHVFLHECSADEWAIHSGNSLLKQHVTTERRKSVLPHKKRRIRSPT